MAENYGIKISAASTEVTDTLTEATKKNFTILSTNSVLKVSAQDYLGSASNIAHSLGFVPIYEVYNIQNSSTEAHPTTNTADSTYVYCNDGDFYVIYLDQP